MNRGSRVGWLLSQVLSAQEGSMGTERVLEEVGLASPVALGQFPTKLTHVDIGPPNSFLGVGNRLSS